MKKFVFIALTMLLFSCSTEENNTEPINQELESSEFENIDALERLALYIKATAEGMNNISLSEEEKLTSLRLANKILFDIGTIRKLAPTNSNNKIDGCSIIKKRCQERYDGCVWWARDFERRFRECSGVQTDYCDNVRESYYANLDIIADEYYQCDLQYIDCVANCGGGGPS